jgi:hypothetical protein
MSPHALCPRATRPIGALAAPAEANSGALPWIARFYALFTNAGTNFTPAFAAQSYNFPVPQRVEWDFRMLSVLSGAVLVAAGSTTLWVFKPRNGMVHPMVLRPFFDTTIAIAVVGVTALGIALLVSGFVG